MAGDDVRPFVEPPFPAPGENRLYLVNTDALINVYPKILASPNCYDMGKGHTWTEVLRRLSLDHARTPFTGAEIHCHGLPEKILLGPDITRDNVEEFGLRLRRVIAPGALIEVLCCMVGRTSFRHEFFADGAAACRHLFDPAQVATVRRYCRTLTDAYEIHDKTEDALIFDKSRNLTAGEAKMEAWRRMAPPQIAWRSIFEIAMRYDTIATIPRSNGLRFSALLSKASGGRVRTAWIEQDQERHAAGWRLIGNWEGFVFEFFDGQLVESYFNLARPQANQPAWVAADLVPTSSAAGRELGRQAVALA